jgi:hypothetical protein
MAWTQTDLDRLDAAIGSGIKLVEYENGRRMYQSTADMLAARTVMQQEINKSAAILSGRKQRNRIRLIPHGQAGHSPMWRIW